MAEITLLKLQVEDASFTAHAPFSGTSEESDSDSGGGNDGTERSGGTTDTRLLPLVIGLVFLVAVAIAARKLRGESEDE